MMPRLQVVVAHRPPFVFVSNTSSGQHFSGLLIDLLNRVLITSNISYQYDITVSPTNAGGTVTNGKWNGVIGELVEQRADIALFPLTRTASRLAAIDCTFSYYDAGLALLVGDGQTNPGPLSVLAPFEMTLWVTLLCTVIGVALLFWALDTYGRWIRGKQFDALRASGVMSDRQVARAKKDDGNPVLISFMAAAGAPERPGRNSWGVQVLYVVYCFFCLIVLSSYTANLTSYLAVRRAYVGVSGLQDLVKDNSLIGVNPNGSTAAYFSTSKDSLATQLQPNVRYCDSATCVNWVRQGVIRAFVTDQPALVYLAQQQPCDTAVVGEPFGPGNLVMGLPKNSSLLPLFNAAIQTFSEDGTLTSLRRTWFEGLSQCEDGAQLESTRLTISQLLGAFVFLAIGVLVAFTTGTVENLKWCLARAYARTYSESNLQTARSLTMRNSEGPFSRSSLLMQQASRLRAATWRRLSVAVLGIPTPPEPAEMDFRPSVPTSLPRTTPPPGPTISGVVDAVMLHALTCTKAPSGTYQEVGSGNLGSSPFGEGAAAATTAVATSDAPPPRDVVLLLHDGGAIADNDKGSSGGCGPKTGCVSGGDAFISSSRESTRGGSLTDDIPGGGSLQLPIELPVLPFADTSVRRAGNDRALPGQPSVSGSNPVKSSPLVLSSAPPQLQPTGLAAAAVAAVSSGRTASPIRSILAAPSRGSSRNGLAVWGKDQDGRCGGDGSPNAAAAHPAVQRNSTSTGTGTGMGTCTGTGTDSSMPHRDELTTFSGASSSDDYDDEQSRISLSFTEKAAAFGAGPSDGVAAPPGGHQQLNGAGTIASSPRGRPLLGPS